MPMHNLHFTRKSILRKLVFAAGATLAGISSYGQAIAPGNSPVSARTLGGPRTPSEAIKLAIANENKLDEKLREMHPLIETYIQLMQPDPDLGTVPRTDHYFLGRLDLSGGVTHDTYVKESTGGFLSRIFNLMPHVSSTQFVPRGFAQMVIMDDGGFDLDHYSFQYVRREFLGDVRCLVYDVTPLKGSGRGRFIGRIWVEDQEYNVVRFNGTYGPNSLLTHYTHFDSWRVQTGPRAWLPAYVYTEESALQASPGMRTIAFKGQSRLWNYQTKRDREREEFTNITVNSAQGVNDKSEQAADNGPVEQYRMWQRQAEDNLLDRLTDSGMLAPAGEVDKVLQTVLDNLIITNNLVVQPEVRVRVMTTTPLESVYVGHTIVISRGMLDVLPDEASLSAIIAHQLGHIVLGHQLDTTYAFNDRMFFEDDQTLRKVDLSRSEGEEAAADQKALEILKKSPYADKLPKVGLFLRMLAARGDELPNLIHPLIGNGLFAGSKDVRLASLLDGAPELAMQKTDQVAALPLGARVKIDPWTSQLSLLKTHNVPLTNPREKLVFEITPVILHLSRMSDSNMTTFLTPAATPDASNTAGATSTSQVRLPGSAQE